MMPKRFMFGVVLVLLPLALATAYDGSSKRSWYIPSQLPNDSNFTQEIRLLALATKLSYTATYGSYFEPGTVNDTLGSDWYRVPELEQNPREGGMHALVFVAPSLGRGLIAFRGTDLGNDTISATADQCADDVLWGGLSYQELSQKCRDGYNASTLDYLTKAISLTKSAFEKYQTENLSWLFTGHSLGAGLAQLMAAIAVDPAQGGSGCIRDPRTESGGSRSSEQMSINHQVVAGAAVFSTPGYIGTLLNRTNSSIEEIVETHKDRFMLFHDEFDPVWYGCKESFQGGFIGHRCSWHDGKEPLPCTLCYSSPDPSPSSIFCELCLAERHIFSHYLKLIDYQNPADGLHCSNTTTSHTLTPYHNYPCTGGPSPPPPPPAGGRNCSSLVRFGCSKLS